MAQAHEPRWLRYEPLFRSVVEHAWDMFLVLDGTYHILYSSPSSARVVGHRPEDLRGRYAFSFVHPDDLARVSEAVGRVRQHPDELARFTHRIRDVEGTWRWMETAVKNLLDRPEVAGVVVHSHDVTERVQLHRQLHHTRLEVLRMRVHPHMIYNLLHSIRMCMQDDPRAAEEMIVMVAELLRVSFEHVDQEEVTLARELAVVRKYFEVEQLRFGDGLTASFEVDPDVEEALVPSLILQPLIENAIHHGFLHRDGAGRVHFSAWRRNDQLHLEIEDDGAGLSGSCEAGSGVGLSSARQRLDQLYGLEGHVAVEDRDRGGTRVHVEMPFRRAPTGA